MENVKNVHNRLYCHDCQKELWVGGDEIKNGVMLVYDNNGEKIKITKCRDCFEKNPALTNFQKCEVYSRVVGYLRPVQQWNTGKKQEFEERKEYQIKAKIEECC